MVYADDGPLGYIVAVDSVSPTVFCISESGDLVRWFDCSDYMREPSDIAVSGKEYFVCDFKVSKLSLSVYIFLSHTHTHNLLFSRIALVSHLPFYSS